MPYAISHIESILTHMRRLAPSLRFVRTDLRLDVRPAPRIGVVAHRSVAFDKSPRRETVVLTDGVSRGAYRIASITRLAMFFGITSEEASEIYLLAEQLHTINPVGSWCLSPTATPNPSRLSSGVANAHPFVDDVLSDVRDALPSIVAIQVVSSVQNLPQGHTRRRVHLRFRKDSHQEVAAVDTAHFSATLSSLLVGTDDHAEHNIKRATHWAEQLSIPLADLPSVLHDLGLLSVSLSSTEIILDHAYEAAPVRKIAQLVR